jgi:hypothetical protein
LYALRARNENALLQKEETEGEGFCGKDVKRKKETFLEDFLWLGRR